jgi:hypothetical protein
MENGWKMEKWKMDLSPLGIARSRGRSTQDKTGLRWVRSLAAPNPAPTMNSESRIIQVSYDPAERTSSGI